MADDSADNTSDDVKTLIRELLEESPLLRRASRKLSHGVYVPALPHYIPKSLTLPCECRDEPTTWKGTKSTTGRDFPFYRGGDQSVETQWDLFYGCADCGKAYRAFWLSITVADVGNQTAKGICVRKLGQDPPWSMTIPRRLDKALGPNAELLKRGLTCLGQGYGIGAAAYFRRVVENEVDALLDLAEEAADLASDDAAKKAIAEARQSHNATERLKIAADVVPESLKPGGMNPLAVLYGHLSRPLHSASEDEALEDASEIFEALSYLFETLKVNLDRSRDFAANMRKLRAKPR